MFVVLVVAALMARADVAPKRDTIDVQLITDEADSVVALANRTAKGSALSSADLHGLTRCEARSSGHEGIVELRRGRAR